VVKTRENEPGREVMMGQRQGKARGGRNRIVRGMD